MNAMEIAMLEEEKKSQDSKSQKDVDPLHWSDDPEKAYFNEMMTGKAEDESLLGNTTVDQMYDREYNETEDESFFRADPNAPFRLAILGPEDDLSTIAGDTISGSVVTEGAVFSNANLPSIITSKRPPHHEPVQRDFKEYELRTPAKQKKRRWNPYAKREDDEETQPESPPGVVGYSEPNKPEQDNSQAEDKDCDNSTFFTYTAPNKRLFICAAIIAAVLILLIGGLAIAYLQVSDDGSDNNSGTSSSSAGLEDFNPDAAPVIPVSSPTEASSTLPFSLWPTTDVMAPTAAPVPVPATEQFNLVSILAKYGVDTSSLGNGDGSPQNYAVNWLASDPNYYSYSEPRMIQRYVLAVVAYSMYNDEARTTPAASILPLWLDYNVNECDWYTSTSDTVCTGFGYYRNLCLRDLNFYGTVPTEIGLLSNSLSFIDFRGNQLEGTLPAELGNITMLQRMQFTGNNITGMIPTEYGRLSTLEVLGVSRNQLTGTIPSELGSVPTLSTLGLSVNNLNGTIPTELGNLGNMILMVLSKNSLYGSIPSELGNLARMTTLEVGYNMFSGQVPWELCNAGSLRTLEADCDAVRCDCCTDCTSPRDETQAATALPNATMAPTTVATTVATTAATAAVTTVATVAGTVAATVAPTVKPTMAPTVCTPFLVWNTTCISVGEPIPVTYQNCDPQNGDWIGIYDKNADPMNLGAPYLWVWACGSQNCRGAPQTNTVLLDENALDNQAGVWPLSKGDYLVFLIRNSGSPYEALLSSEKMKIEDQPCQ